MYASLEATTQVVSVCPVQAFVNGGLLSSFLCYCLTQPIYAAKPLITQSEDGEPVMYDPLAWWYGQRCSGNEHDGLTQMALDVLSTPGESVSYPFLYNSNTLVNSL